MNAKAQLVVKQLRELADELERNPSASIDSFEVGQRMSSGVIEQSLHLVVYHSANSETISNVFGISVDEETTLEEI